MDGCPSLQPSIHTIKNFKYFHRGKSGLENLQYKPRKNMKKNILLVTMMLGTMVACKKESTTNPTTTPTETTVEKAKKVLMSGDWVLESNSMSMGNGPYVPIPLEDCEKDDYARYTTDKQILFFGTEKCEPEENSSDTISYSFNAKADSITFIDIDGPITYSFSNPATNKIEMKISSAEYGQKIVLKKKSL